MLPSESLSALIEAVTSTEDRRMTWPFCRKCGGGRIVSPNRFLVGGWPRWFPSGYTGIPAEATFAFNSGSLLRVAALRQAGGYSSWFWLDSSDANLFRQLAKLGKSVYICGKVQLAHELSLQNMAERVSPVRYRTILLAESAFWDLEMNAFAGLERTLRLLGRTAKHVLRRDSAELRRLTVEALRLRLFHTRRFRIDRWRELTAPLIASFAEPASFTPQPLTLQPGVQPKVSVCMAAYNGERFLNEQLASILPQLSAGDEMILIDDRSTDGTLALLEQFRSQCAARPGSPTIVLIAHRENRGVISTFEEAVRAATGDILFLSDDDDRWAPDKVHRMLAAFAEDDSFQLVSTGVAMIDEAGQPIASSDFLRHRRFSAGFAANLLHNQFQGSALALRSSALQYVLPFPRGKLFLHDAWIGLRILLHGGKVRHLEAPLLLYRRHGANVSRRLDRWRQGRLRLQLLIALLRAATHRL